MSVSHATRAVASSWSTASRTASQIWSAILSGCPSVTDSDVNSNVRALMAGECSRRSGLLHRRLTLHEPCDQVGERGAVEHRADTFRDGHLHLEPVRKIPERRGGGQPFHDHPDGP